MRLSELWAIAPTLPITIVAMASAASAGAHVATAPGSASSRKRRITPKAAALVATAMKVVTGVGAPWYTSGVHWWKGATEALNARPVTVSATPMRRRGSATGTALPTAGATDEKSVAPVAPYTNASPYSRVAEPSDPITRYLSPDSSDARRRTWVAHSTYSGIDSSSSPKKNETRLLAAESITIPATEPSSSVRYSAIPASRTASERSDRRTVAIPARQKSRVRKSASVSKVRAPAMIGLAGPGFQFHTASAAVASSVA